MHRLTAKHVVELRRPVKEEVKGASELVLVLSSLLWDGLPPIQYPQDPGGHFLICPMKLTCEHSVLTNVHVALPSTWFPHNSSPLGKERVKLTAYHLMPRTSGMQVLSCAVEPGFSLTFCLQLILIKMFLRRNFTGRCDREVCTFTFWC